MNFFIYFAFKYTYFTNIIGNIDSSPSVNGGSSAPRHMYNSLQQYNMQPNSYHIQSSHLICCTRPIC